MLVDPRVTGILFNLDFTNFFTVSILYIEVHDDGQQVPGQKIVLREDEARTFLEDRCKLGFLRDASGNERQPDGKFFGAQENLQWLKDLILTKTRVIAVPENVHGLLTMADEAIERERKAQNSANAAIAARDAAIAARESAEAVVAAKEASAALLDLQITEREQKLAALEAKETEASEPAV